MGHLAISGHHKKQGQDKWSPQDVVDIYSVHTSKVVPATDGVSAVMEAVEVAAFCALLLQRKCKT